MSLHINEKFTNLAQFKQITNITTKEQGNSYVAEVRVKINGEGYTIRVYSKEKMTVEQAEKKLEDQIEKVIILTTRFMHDGVSKIFIDKDMKNIDITKVSGVKTKEVKFDFERQKEGTITKSQPKIDADASYTERLDERVERMDKAIALRDVNRDLDKEEKDLKERLEKLKNDRDAEQQNQAAIIDDINRTKVQGTKLPKVQETSESETPLVTTSDEEDRTSISEKSTESLYQSLSDELESSEEHIEDLEEQIEMDEADLKSIEEKRDALSRSEESAVGEAEDEEPPVIEEGPVAVQPQPPRQEVRSSSTVELQPAETIQRKVAQVLEASPPYKTDDSLHPTSFIHWIHPGEVLELKDDSTIARAETIAGGTPSNEDQEDFVASLEREFRRTFNQLVNKHPLEVSNDLDHILEKCDAFARTPPFYYPPEKAWYDPRRFVEGKPQDPYVVFKAKLEEAIPRMIACANLYRCLTAEKLDGLYPDVESNLRPTAKEIIFVESHHEFMEELILGPHVEAMTVENRLSLLAKYDRYLADHADRIPDALMRRENVQNEIDRLIKLSLSKGVLRLSSSAGNILARRKHGESYAGRAEELLTALVGVSNKRTWQQALTEQLNGLDRIETLANDLGLKPVEAEARKAQSLLARPLEELVLREEENESVAPLKERIAAKVSEQEVQVPVEIASHPADVNLTEAIKEISAWLEIFAPGRILAAKQFDKIALEGLHNHLQIPYRVLREGDPASKAEALRICETVHEFLSNPKINYEPGIKEKVAAFQEELGTVLERDPVYIKKELLKWIEHFTPGYFPNTIQEKDLQKLRSLITPREPIQDADKAVREDTVVLIDKLHALLNNKRIKTGSPSIKEALDAISREIETARQIPDSVKELHKLLNVPSSTYPAEKVYAIAKGQYGEALVDRVVPMLFGDKAELTRKEMLVLIAAMAVFVKKEDLAGKSLDHFRQLERGIPLMASLGIPFDPIKFSIDNSYLSGLSRAQRGTLCMLADIESSRRWATPMQSAVAPDEAEAGLRRFIAAKKDADTLFHTDKYANILVIASHAASLMRHAASLPPERQQQLQHEVLTPVRNQIRNLMENGSEVYGPQIDACISALNTLNGFIEADDAPNLEYAFSINPRENPLLQERHLDAYMELQSSEYLADKVANIPKYLPKENRGLCEGMLFHLDHAGGQHLFEVAATVAKPGFRCQILVPVDKERFDPVPIKLAFEGITTKPTMQMKRALTLGHIIEMFEKKTNLETIRQTVSLPGSKVWRNNDEYQLISDELINVLAQFEGQKVALECTGKALGAADAQYAATYIAENMAGSELKGVTSLNVKTYGGYGISQEAADRFRDACRKNANENTRFAVFHNVVAGNMIQLIGEACLTTEQANTTYFLESTASGIGLKGNSLFATMWNKMTSAFEREGVAQFSSSEPLMQYRLLHPSHPLYAYYTEKMGKKAADGTPANLIRHLMMLKAYDETPELTSEEKQPSLGKKTEVIADLAAGFKELKSVKEMSMREMKDELKEYEGKRMNAADTKRYRDIQTEMTTRKKMTPRQVRNRIKGLNRGGLTTAGIAMAKGLVMGKPQRLLVDEFEM